MDVEALELETPDVSHDARAGDELGGNLNGWNVDLHMRQHAFGLGLPSDRQIGGQR